MHGRTGRRAAQPFPQRNLERLIAFAMQPQHHARTRAELTLSQQRRSHNLFRNLGTPSSQSLGQDHQGIGRAHLGKHRNRFLPLRS